MYFEASLTVSHRSVSSLCVKSSHSSPPIGDDCESYKCPRDDDATTAPSDESSLDMLNVTFLCVS